MMARSHMYRINISEKRVASDVVNAWLRGEARGGSTRIRFDGTHHELWSFQGRTRFLTGRMDFWHYESRVLSVDFDQDLITDYGFLGFSSTTTRYLNAWLSELRQASVHHMVSLAMDLHPLDWTRTVHNTLRGAGHHEDMWQRFRAGVPWAKKIGDNWWFHGPSFSEALLGQYYAGRDAVLTDMGWHWFTCDWDAEGRWSKRFIDADAERRWNKRQTKRAA